MAMCFALQKLATQINDMFQSGRKREERYPRNAERETTPTTSCVPITYKCNFRRTRKNC